MSPAGAGGGAGRGSRHVSPFSRPDIRPLVIVAASRIVFFFRGQVVACSTCAVPRELAHGAKRANYFNLQQHCYTALLINAGRRPRRTRRPRPRPRRAVVLADAKKKEIRSVYKIKE
ncbi:hypothetical protein EVAR_8134_1 [Eumeta japonica]|uniref:Uncharacterized protein n=1 Tax=Eumeta variegata TaxID=151549 RepID=A0A4C1TST5_EUMVA|nr:hypothetical protein EVAR_8134_1 [Eumeta japonica]